MPRSAGARVEKITVSLPREAVAYADSRARAERTSRSRVIADALALARREEETALAAEGYRFYAGEAAAFAEDSQRAIAEALGDAG
jgi:metal-responsive CopG/Arc/MetJ family transcriptional regulator